jgi:hypothetical protein
MPLILDHVPHGTRNPLVPEAATLPVDRVDQPKEVPDDDHFLDVSQTQLGPDVVHDREIRVAIVLSASEHCDVDGR